MTPALEWHLTKGFNVGLIIALVGIVATSGVVWANTLNKIDRNAEHNEMFHTDLSVIKADVKIIREGLIAEGIIKVK